MTNFNTNLRDRFTLPVTENTIPIFEGADLDRIAVAGVITIAVSTEYRIQQSLSTDVEFVIGTGVELVLTGRNRSVILTYTGTGTFISGTGRPDVETITLNSSSTGTFIDVTLPSPFVSVGIDNVSLTGWDDLGEITNGAFFLGLVALGNIGIGFTLTDLTTFAPFRIAQFGFPFLAGPLFTYKSKVNAPFINCNNLTINNLSSTGSVFDIDPATNNNGRFLLEIINVPVGSLFKQSVLADAAFTVVADGSIATGTITAQASNGSGGTTHSCTTTYFEDEEVVITGTTSYNGTFQIFNVVAGVSFDTITSFGIDDATGSVDTERLTVTLTGGHGMSTGNAMKIINGRFYNAFYTALNIATNTLTINGTFIETDTGNIERELSIDQSDPRVLANGNPEFESSQIFAFGMTHNFATVTTVTDGVYAPVTLGALSVEGSERLRLVDDDAGIWEVTGHEPVTVVFAVSAWIIKAGATPEDYRMAVSINGAVPTFATEPYERMVATNVAVQSFIRLQAIGLVEGDTIQPMIAGDGTGTDITFEDFTIQILGNPN